MGPIMQSVIDDDFITPKERKLVDKEEKYLRITPEEFLKNLGTAAKSLQQALPKVLSFIAEKPFQA